MIVEDHHVVRAGLVALLSMADDIEVVAQAKDGLQAIQEWRLHHPDVVLTDLRLPEISGAGVITNLRKESKKLRFIVLTAYDGEEDVFRAIQAGAHAYLLKGSTNEELLATIRLVYEGKSQLSPEIEATLMKRLNSKRLSKRENQVLEKIVQGLSNREIGLQLGVAEVAVKAYVNDLMRKLGVGDRTQAAMAAIQRGIVPLNSPKSDICK